MGPDYENDLTFTEYTLGQEQLEDIVGILQKERVEKNKDRMGC